MKKDKPYLEKTFNIYNPQYGNYRVCICGHRYYRHFDSYEDNEPVGCKYCPCSTFVEATLNSEPLVLKKEDILGSEFIGLVRSEDGETLGVLFPIEYVEELCKDLSRLKMLLTEYPEMKEDSEFLNNFSAIWKEVEEVYHA